MHVATDPAVRSAGPQYAISLRPADLTGEPVLVGVQDGRPISDDDLRAASPTLGRVLAMLRRMDRIMTRTADTPERRPALLNELAESFWCQQIADAMEWPWPDAVGETDGADEGADAIHIV